MAKVDNGVSQNLSQILAQYFRVLDESFQGGKQAFLFRVILINLYLVTFN